jgi:hypothetical protein
MMVLPDVVWVSGRIAILPKRGGDPISPSGPLNFVDDSNECCASKAIRSGVARSMMSHAGVLCVRRRASWMDGGKVWNTAKMAGGAKVGR